MRQSRQPAARKRSGKASQLSRRLGVSRQRVYALKQTGKLKLTAGDIDVSESVRMHAERLAAQTSSPARKIKEHYEAKMAKLEYEKAAGLLLEKAAVERDAFRNGRQIRDGLLSFADRLAALLAAESDANKIHALLTKEVHQLLAQLANPAEGIDANAT